MAFVVETFKSEDDLAADIGATVITHKSEDELNDYLNGLTSEVFGGIVAKGGHYTTIVDISVPAGTTVISILDKGGFYTVVKDVV